ncbi:MAG: tetratricopeptide repeat protein [candidate division Zixibacteria bacterium]|nr:tetratricopeptide repeat protein [candidate division Zixibacteria bacterium]
MKIKKRKVKPILKRARKPAEAAAETRLRKIVKPVLERWRVIAAAVAAVVVVAAGIGGYFAYRHDREVRAARAYARAQGKITDMVRDAAEKSGEERKLAEDEIDAKTASELESVVERYGDTATGRAAKYTLASLYFDQGKYDEAQKLFKTLEDKASGLEKALAAKGVADCYKARLEYGAAISKYRDVFESHKFEFPAVPVAMDLAECYRETGRPKAAAEMYQYILDYHPLSPYAEQAARELKNVEAVIATKG